MTIEKVNRIKEILEHLPETKVEGLKKLFWEELNYDIDNSPLSQALWTDEFKAIFVSTPVSFATYAINNEFHIIYCHLTGNKLLLGNERKIINNLIKDYPFSLFIFTNETQDNWHFVNAISAQKVKDSKQRIIRRISVSSDDRLRTASERIAYIDTNNLEQDLFGISPIKIQQLHDTAFNVEAVTEEFFNEYKVIFSSLTAALFTHSKDRIWAHDFALQFMNRLMFIYYLERKRWLGNNPDFLHDFWREYLKAYRGSDDFVDKWLNILFFEAFNNKFASGRSDIAYIPEVYREALQLAPYLNGGLFRRNDLDELYQITIKDELMRQIFEFLDKYNFTISEDTPLDQEVAVDPEMIGKVYESLVNVSEEADEQGDAGIFYTPRIEIDLMCRLSLVDWLSNQLPVVNKNIFYEMVFAFSPDEKEEADMCVHELNLWQEIDSLLTSMTVLDPACGSGSFLVGMLGILDDLIVRAEKYLDKSETPYERRKRIIGNSLYGVDIMEWAVHVAELRLWLQLVIETDLELGERRTHPLLPNLSFKIRHGDSLVQEVGGINFSLYRQGGNIKGSTKSKLTGLKTEKLKFYQNDPTCKYHNNQQVEQDEFLLFNEIINDQIDTHKKKQAELIDTLSPKKNLFGEVQEAQMDINNINQSKELEQINLDLERLQNAKTTLQTQRAIPFVWDIAFVEIFEGEKRGFDIVIGNPPYTRQEAIRDLTLPQEKITKENKKAYKEKLAKAVYNAWPKTFGYNPVKGTAVWELDKKSDLYIYFYFIGLSLLNEKGSSCFITSNAWLDVGYGSDLQAFLLTRANVRFVIDNQVKRSFKKVDVNTIIILISKPKNSKSEIKACLESKAGFAMFKVPYEETLSPVIWEEIEEITEKKVTQEYRILKSIQMDLFNTGKDDETQTYAGDKWGGKYLRAPDIYWYIQEKCSDKLVRLNQIADVRFGIKTGANEFFYLDQVKIDQWGIEEEYLVHILKGPRDFKNYEVDTSNIKTKMLLVNDDFQTHSKKNVFNYIKWGESIGYNNNESVKNRRYWYSLPEIKGNAFWGKEMRDRLAVFSSPEICYADCRLYISTINDLEKAIVNSAIYILFTEVLARDLGGGGGPRSAMVYEVQSQFVPNPELYDNKDEIELIFNTMKSREVFNIFNEILMPDRHNLDELICSKLGLSKVDLGYIYETISEIVNRRLKKAESV